MSGTTPIWQLSIPGTHDSYTDALRYLGPSAKVDDEGADFAANMNAILNAYSDILWKTTGTSQRTGRCTPNRTAS